MNASKDAPDGDALKELAKRLFEIPPQDDQAEWEEELLRKLENEDDAEDDSR